MDGCIVRFFEEGDKKTTNKLEEEDKSPIFPLNFSNITTKLLLRQEISHYWGVINFTYNIIKYIYTALKKETTFVAMYQQQLFFCNFFVSFFWIVIGILYHHSIS